MSSPYNDSDKKAAPLEEKAKATPEKGNLKKRKAAQKGSSTGKASKGGPIDPELERKRKISRLSSQRLRQREKERFEDLQTRQADLTTSNEALKQDSELVKKQIEQVKQIIKLKAELGPAAASSRPAVAETLAAAAATLGANPLSTAAAAAASPSAAAASSSAPSLSLNLASNIPPSVLLAMAQVKASVPFAYPAAASSKRADPPGVIPGATQFALPQSQGKFTPQLGSQLGSGSFNAHRDILAMLQAHQLQKQCDAVRRGISPPSPNTIIAQNLIRHSIADARANPHVPNVAASGCSEADSKPPASKAARQSTPSTAAASARPLQAPGPATTTPGTNINDFFAQVLQRGVTPLSGSGVAPTPTPGNSDTNAQDYLLRVLHASSQQHQQAAAAMEQLRSMLLLQGMMPQQLPVPQAQSALPPHLLGLLASPAPVTAASPASNNQELIRLIQLQSQKQQHPQHQPPPGP